MNPPFCSKCGCEAKQGFAQVAIKNQTSPFGICKICYEIVKLVPLPDRSGVAPFLETVSYIVAPPELLQARREIMMRVGVAPN